MTSALHTRRLRLEPCAPEDERDFVALFQDPVVSWWLGGAAGPAPVAQDRSRFRRLLRSGAESWTVRLDGRYAGHAEIARSPRSDGHELFLALTPHVHGRGLGAEVAGALTAYAFYGLGLPRLHATATAGNSPALALLHSLGYVHTHDVTGSGARAVRFLTRELARAARPAEVPARAVREAPGRARKGPGENRSHVPQFPPPRPAEEARPRPGASRRP